MNDKAYVQGVLSRNAEIVAARRAARTLNKVKEEGWVHAAGQRSRGVYP